MPTTHTQSKPNKLVSRRSPKLAQACHPISLPIEPLESRTLLAVAPIGPEFVLPAAGRPVTAMDDAGNFVVVWNYAKNPDGSWSAAGIHAQLYSASGTPRGQQFTVSDSTVNAGFAPSAPFELAVAMDADGDFVVAWGADSDIHARRFNSAGIPRSDEFVVNTYTTGNQADPAIAMDDAGNFVIAWHSGTWSDGQDGSAYGIYAQRFNQAGRPQGTEFRVNTYTTGAQLSPSVAMDSDGDFVIAWSSYQIDLQHVLGVYAQRYDAAGAPQGNEFLATTPLPSYYYGSVVALAMSPDGDFVIISDNDANALFGQRYNALGEEQGDAFRIDTQPGTQVCPAVSMDDAGNFVVAWCAWVRFPETVVQRYTAAGEPLGGNFSPSTANDSTSPALAVAPNGDFVVIGPTDNHNIYARLYTAIPNPASITGRVWHDANVNGLQDQDEAGRDGIQVSLLDDSGAIIDATRTANGGLYRFNDVAPGYPYKLRFGWPRGFLFTDQDAGADDTLDSDVSITNGRTAPFTPGPDQTLTFDAGLIRQANLSGNVYLDFDANHKRDPDELPLSGWIIYLDDNSNAQPDPDEAFRTTDPNGNYAFTGIRPGSHILRLVPQDHWIAAKRKSISLASGQSIVNINFGNQSTANIFAAGPIGSEFPVFDGGDNMVTKWSLASDRKGNYIAVWSVSVPRHADGQSYVRILARRFNPAGKPIGDAFQVDETPLSLNARMHIAVGPDGSFIIVWSGNTSAQELFYARQYNAAGQPLGKTLLLKATTTYLRDVAVNPTGGFIAYWYSPDKRDRGVYAQFLDAAGSPVSSPFRIHANDLRAPSYTTPSISLNMSTDGSFIATWSDTVGDSQQYALYACRFSASAQPLGPEFRVSTYPAADAGNVAMNPDGSFIISWTGQWQDSNTSSACAQRYDAAGVPQGGEFRVNSLHDAYASGVAADADGNFIITWIQSEPRELGAPYDSNVYAQRYNAAGVPLGPSFRVNTFTDQHQYGGPILFDADGNFTIAWVSEVGVEFGVRAQRYEVSKGTRPLVLGSSAPDTFYITRSGDDVVIYNSTEPVGLPAAVFPFESITTLTIAGGAGRDSVIIDFSNGNPLPSGGLTFKGGKGKDSLAILGADPDNDLVQRRGQARFGSSLITYTSADNIITEAPARTSARRKPASAPAPSAPALIASESAPADPFLPALPFASRQLVAEPRPDLFDTKRDLFA